MANATISTRLLAPCSKADAIAIGLVTNLAPLNFGRCLPDYKVEQVKRQEIGKVVRLLLYT